VFFNLKATISHPGEIGQRMADNQRWCDASIAALNLVDQKSDRVKWPLNVSYLIPTENGTGHTPSPIKWQSKT